MLTYRKKLEGQLEFHYPMAKKNDKLKQINFSHTNSDRFENAIMFELPCGERIVMDAYYLKCACEKIIKLEAI